MRRFLVFGLIFALLGSAAPPRLVALMPAMGDDLFAMGAGPQVVGVSRFTEDNPAAKNLPLVADFQSVDVEKIVALHPDVVVGDPSQAALVAPLRRAGIRVVLLADDSYEDIFTNLRILGDLSGRRSQANALILRLQRETEQLRARARRFAYRPRVFFALGTGPIWTAGHGSYLATLLGFAGARNAAADLPVPWGEYSEEALLRAQPDAIVADYETPLRDVLTREPWRSLRAVREGHVFLVENRRIDDALFRPGPNYNEGLRWLIERLSPLSTSKIPGARSNPNS
ncbi:MAG TPA: ABC transporter substrate-binding protein [Candidatus Baltobacteraceae bacterium]|nr:ABC transporter substrate-binding protein [Candidatus Baltobacteraceae bacterium]